MDRRNKHKVLLFLRQQKLAVISTVDPANGKPESALVAFAEDDDLCLYFQTGVHTRKAQNLKSNPQVSFVIGLGMDPMVTVQYEGRAERLADQTALEACKRLFIAKDSPTTEEYFNHPSAIFFRVTPTWIGCSDYTGERPEVVELQDF